MYTKQEMDEIRHAGVDEWNRRWWNPLEGTYTIPHEVIVDYAERKGVPVEDVGYGHGCLIIKNQSKT